MWSCSFRCLMRFGLLPWGHCCIMCKGGSWHDRNMVFMLSNRCHVSVGSSHVILSGHTSRSLHCIALSVGGELNHRELSGRIIALVPFDESHVRTSRPLLHHRHTCHTAEDLRWSFRIQPYVHRLVDNSEWLVPIAPDHDGTCSRGVWYDGETSRVLVVSGLVVGHTLE